MSDFQINNHLFDKECSRIAAEIFEQTMGDADPDETAGDLRDDMSDAAHEYIDGHGWVIYHYKAMMICAHCNVTQGEEFLRETGLPDDPTISSLASIIVYGEMRARVEAALESLIETWEPPAEDAA